MSERGSEGQQGKTPETIEQGPVAADGKEARELLELFKLEEAQQDDVGAWRLGM